MCLSLAGTVAAPGAAEIVYEYEEEPADTAAIPEVTSLQKVADMAKTRGVPILVEFSTPWCR